MLKKTIIQLSTIFNNISAISWWLVLLMGEAGVSEDIVEII
jgi:hypothetical protein